MNIGQAFKMAWKSIWGKKGRSALTILSIFIGIAAVMTIVSIMEGMKAKSMEQFEAMGTNRITVSVYSWSYDEQGNPLPAPDYFDKLYQFCNSIPDLVIGVTPTASDAVLLMTYEWGYTYGPPMAVAPVGAVRRVVEFALTQMDAAKILLGFPNYAYDWTLPFTAGATRAQSIGNEAAPLLAAQYGAEIQFDTQSQTPYFTYLDEAGQPHEVWFEDVRSAQAKFALLPEYGLLGLGYWNFMRPFTAGFSLQNYLFTASGLR